MELKKRAFDVFWSGLGLLLLWPLFLVIALLIKVDDGGTVFFRQERVGYRGKVFWIYKFRTMTPDAERTGRHITVGSDPRITRTGKWLRKTKLDELPQLINVLKGEMTLVGPRPEVPKYVAMYDDDQRRVLELVPGITDPASIKYRNESELLATAYDPEHMYIDEIMPDKIAINMDYAARATLLTDFLVVLHTLFGRSPRFLWDSASRSTIRRSTDVIGTGSNFNGNIT
ncbi:MAG: sugar transferase [Alicyclobacillus sp.]|nr:sugar transferase [Alicyclobacillus sp.]